MLRREQREIVFDTVSGTLGDFHHIDCEAIGSLEKRNHNK
jgi:hypothetical protein